jgi:Na+-driven multidrug efflux pump
MLVIFASVLATIFSDDPAVIELIILFLLIVPASYAFQGLQMVIGSILNALHQPIDAMLLSIIRLFVLYVPFAYVGSIYFGVEGIFWSMVISSVLACAIAYLWVSLKLKTLLKPQYSN